MADAPTTKSEARAAPRRGGSDRREPNDRRAKACLQGKAEGRTKKTKVTNERRAGADRRDASRRQGLRRAGKNRRDK